MINPANSSRTETGVRLAICDSLSLDTVVLSE